jgi:hypothetical protein
VMGRIEEQMRGALGEEEGKKVELHFDDFNAKENED